MFSAYDGDCYRCTLHLAGAGLTSRMKYDAQSNSCSFAPCLASCYYTNYNPEPCVSNDPTAGIVPRPAPFVPCESKLPHTPKTPGVTSGKLAPIMHGTPQWSPWLAPLTTVYVSCSALDTVTGPTVYCLAPSAAAWGVQYITKSRTRSATSSALASLSFLPAGKASYRES